MKRSRVSGGFAVVVLLFAFTAAGASEVLEWSVNETLSFDAAPIDIAAAPDGRRLFVLTDQGKIFVYSSGAQADTVIDVGPHVNRIQAGPRADTLILGSSKSRTVQLITVDFVQEIDTSASPFKGPETAPVVIAVFDDFQCPYCARLVPVLDQMRAKYPQDVKVVFKHFPLQNHPFAVKAAIASIAAEDQGKFWELHDLLFEHHNRLDDEKIEELARAAGLDPTAYEKKKQDPAVMQKLNRDFVEGKRIGVSGTPTVFINGVRLQDRSPEGFQKAIDKQLQKHKQTAGKPSP